MERQCSGFATSRMRSGQSRHFSPHFPPESLSGTPPHKPTAFLPDGTIHELGRLTMAKTRARTAKSVPPPPASVEAARAADSKLLSYAETLGTAMGQLRNHVDSWNGQRKHLVDRLSTLVNEAQSLLTDLGHNAASGVERLRGRRRPKKFAPPDSNPAGALKPRKREKGVTEARRAAMSVELKPRPTRYRSARATNK